MKAIMSLLVLTACTQTFAQPVVTSESTANDGVSSRLSDTLQSNNTSEIASSNPSPAMAVNSKSVVMQLDQATVFIDPVGAQIDYRRFGRPDIVVLTRAAPSHLSIDTMIGLLRRDTVVLAPQAVIDQLPLMISNNVITPFNSGTMQQVHGITFRALDRSGTIPEDAYLFRRDRGDIGVLVEVDGNRMYF